MANDTVYGLAAGLSTSDINLAHRAAREIKAGLVWINGWDPATSPCRSAVLSSPASDATDRCTHCTNTRTSNRPRSRYAEGHPDEHDHTPLPQRSAHRRPVGHRGGQVSGARSGDGTRRLGACRTSAPRQRARPSMPLPQRSRHGPARPPKSGRQVLRRWFDLIIADTEPLAQLMTSEQGKPWPKRAARLPMAPRSSSGSPRKEARLRAYDPDDHGAEALHYHQAADWRRGGDRAVEFPDCHDHAQGSASAGRRLHGRDQAVGGDAAVRAGAGQAGARCRGCLRACSTSSPHLDAPAVGKRAVRGQPRAQAVVHRLDAGRQAALSPVRRHGRRNLRSSLAATLR